jgi:hypothetical protein
MSSAGLAITSAFPAMRRYRAWGEQRRRDIFEQATQP